MNAACALFGPRSLRAVLLPCAAWAGALPAADATEVSLLPDVGVVTGNRVRVAPRVTVLAPPSARAPRRAQH